MPKTITRKTIYLGARAEVKEIRQGGPTGEREIRIRWIDPAVGQVIEWPAGTVTSRTVKGDGRKNSFVVIVPEHAIDSSAF